MMGQSHGSDVGGDNNRKQDGALLLQAHVNILIITCAHGPRVLRHYVAQRSGAQLGRGISWDDMHL